MPELNDTPNYTDMFARSFASGREQARQKGIQNALSMAPADPTGAASALTQYGEFGGANALMQNAAAQKTLQVQRQVAPQVQSGDFTGAANTAAAAGQYDIAGQLSKMDDTSRAHAAATADVMARAAFGLSQVPQADRPAALQKIKPVLLAQHIPEQVIDQADLSDQGLQAIAGQAMSVKDTIASHQKDQEISNTADRNKAAAAQAAATLKESSEFHRATLAQGGERLAIEGQRANAAQIQVLQDPKTGTPYRYNAATGQATMLDGKTPYNPQGAEKMSSGTARSAPAMAMKAFLEQNPNASPEEISQFNGKIKQQGAAAVAFGTGKQGQTVNSLNVGISHLDTLGQLATAMGNSDIPAVNRIGQAWTTQTGGPAPNNFNAAKQIVGDEVVKAIVGAGGTGGDREKAQSMINAAGSPAQLAGAIQTVKTLMAGQLHGLRLQYKNSTGLNDFETHLAPATARQLEAIPLDSAPSKAGRPPLSAIFGH